MSLLGLFTSSSCWVTSRPPLKSAAQHLHQFQVLPKHLQVMSDAQNICLQAPNTNSLRSQTAMQERFELSQGRAILGQKYNAKERTTWTDNQFHHNHRTNQFSNRFTNPCRDAAFARPLARFMPQAATAWKQKKDHESLASRNSIVCRYVYISIGNLKALQSNYYIIGANSFKDHCYDLWRSSRFAA